MWSACFAKRPRTPSKDAERQKLIEPTEPAEVSQLERERSIGAGDAASSATANAFAEDENVGGQLSDVDLSVHSGSGGAAWSYKWNPDINEPLADVTASRGPQQRRIKLLSLFSGTHPRRLLMSKRASTIIACAPAISRWKVGVGYTTIILTSRPAISSI